MSLDYPTLLAAFTLSGCGLAAAFLASWLASRKEGFLIAWTIGVALMAVGVLVYNGYVATMSPILGAAGYSVLLTGLAFVFGAGREFRTRILPWRIMAIMASVSVVAVSVPMLIGYNGSAIILLNVAATIILLVTAWDYWIGRAEAVFAISLLAALYVLTALSFVPCALILLMDGQWVVTDMPSNWAEDLNIVVCLASLAGIGALSLGLNQARQARGHKRDAETDALTGLLNRRALLDRVSSGLQGPITLVIFDIDHFKQINDVHGHPAGDEVLRVFGEIMLLSAQPPALAARLGGEEFALLLPEATMASAAVAADAIRMRLAKRQFAGNGQSFRASLCAGVASTQDRSLDFDALLHEADKALYAAKRNGRNCVAVSADGVEFLANVRRQPHEPVDLVRLKLG